MGDAADDYVNYLLSLDFDNLKDNSRHITIHGSLTHQTEKAYLWNRLNHTNYWVPKSQVFSIAEDHICVTTWIADKLGWEEDD